MLFVRFVGTPMIMRKLMKNAHFAEHQKIDL